MKFYYLETYAGPTGGGQGGKFHGARPQGGPTALKISRGRALANVLPWDLNMALGGPEYM